MGCSKNTSKRDVCSNTILPEQTRNISNKQLNFTPKATTERTNKTQSQQKKRNQRAKINEIEAKTIEKTNETRSQFFEKINKVDKLDLSRKREGPN